MILLIPTHPCHLQNLLDPAIDTIKRLLESSWISWIELTADGESRSAAISCNLLSRSQMVWWLVNFAASLFGLGNDSGTHPRCDVVDNHTNRAISEVALVTKALSKLFRKFDRTRIF
jgi:hypothetical protein